MALVLRRRCSRRWKESESEEMSGVAEKPNGLQSRLAAVGTCGEGPCGKENAR